MSSLTAPLEPYMVKAKTFVLDTIRRIEESSWFERIVSEYESLEIRQQKWIQASLVILGMVGVLLVFSWPISSVWQQKGDLNSVRKLITDMKAFQDHISVVRQPAPRPAGFQQLPASSAPEFEESFKQFLASISLGGDGSDLQSIGAGQWKLDIPELSIRQALTILFQLDGWFPAVKVDRYRLVVNPENKELLTFEANLRFGDGSAFTGGNGASIDDEGAPAPTTHSNNARSSSTSSSIGTGDGASRAAGTGSRSNQPPPPAPPGGSFGDEFDDLPPPTFEEDM
ncbi:MAG: hypothetical protein JST16_11325 [Bdellovibrionales bacterium]|nr:hypothetical protein [Bdellovibrionales bacterium]